MKKFIYILLVIGLLLGSALTIGVLPVEAKTRSYKSYSSKTYKIRTYKSGGKLKWQNGYFKKTGSYIQSHFKTGPDQYKWNNRKSLYGF